MRKKNEVIDLENYRAADGQDATEGAPQHLPPGTTLLLGQYTINGYLNCGGFGITYRAHDSLGREVVIKECFPSELAYRNDKSMGARSPKYKEELDSIVQHFVKEAHRLASARHDNIVHVHQIFEENDTAYMPMDYVDGPDLLDIMESDPDQLGPPEVERLVRKLLGAIEFVHELGLLHRDISPDNILIDKTGEPILIDFGSAREYAAQATKRFTRLKFVKDGYSPQEFYIAGSEQGTWSDLYSFAASMYHVITGAPPEDGQKRLAALAAKQPDPYVPLAGHVSGYSVRFLKAIDKALETLPENRIQTAREWLDLITPKTTQSTDKAQKPVKRVLENMPAFEDTAISGTWARIWTNNKPALAAGLAGIALLGAAGVFALQRGMDETLAGSTPATTGTDGPVFAATDAPAQPEVAVSPEVDIVVLSSDQAVSRMVATRVPTPPAVSVEPLEQAEISIGSEPKLATPVITLRQPPLPSGLTPVERAEAITALVDPEQAVVPSIPVQSAPTGLEFMPTQLAAPKLGSIIEAQPEFIEAVSFFAPEVETDAPALTDLSVPSVKLPVLDAAAFAPADDGTDADVKIVLAPADGVARATAPLALPVSETDAPAAADTTTPPPATRVGPLAEQQVAYAHWDVRMPFEATTARVRNAITAEITAVSDNADLSRAGDWIAEGVVIYSFNGERLIEGMPLSGHFLQTLAVDPDGYSRATVRYRNPDTGVIDRGLLSVPVVRQIGLADGSVIEAYMSNLVWVLEVVEIGAPDNGLAVGDILASEAVTGIDFSRPDDLSTALEALVSQDVKTAELTVLRNGDRQQVAWQLARK